MAFFCDMTAMAAQTRAHFAATLTFEALPARVAGRAKDCLHDTIAAATFGARFPWSKRVTDYARRYGGGGQCTVIIMQPQCSVPFCVAVALHRDREVPKSCAGGALEDQRSAPPAETSNPVSGANPARACLPIQ